ncbi:lantibiotic dehydratase-like protein [Streptomyces mobaraensis NBRC 13819 = DSM 40847]|uniref:Lantibiotic dehydratase-like protein n=1 Tax=Streptomyces mobaraensis (strain ATCC 29032 / DSM 40847 / JCM 4168 / NBRC 13819 / NCIMB 11159 / IPCR 16-22) TaxID=1223523 RepID=M3BRT5_STRM1|nr:lantibiotic dehydratase [Streptomyces mobaraensis]EMF02400.1 lantibiotic dehydratase-like protein [Streptomyces mobaraensis NBRC 13819 = DSM 40847]
MPDLDLYGDDVTAQGCQWLAEVWRDPIPDALAAASPVLCQRVAEILDGAPSDARRIRRVVRSVAAYLLRWNHRPTPFGVFAGVAPAVPAHTARVQWGDRYRTVLRPDSDWLTDVITQLEADPAVLARLSVVANNTGRSRGTRHVVDGMPTDARTAGYAPVELSVRRTRPVAAVLAAARTPIPYDVLVHSLTEQFPSARPDQLTGLIADLVSKHILISSLWPPMTSVDTLHHLCNELEKAGTASIAELASQLASIRDGLNHPDADAPWTPGARLSLSMQRVSATGRVPLLVDAALDCALQVPEAVLNEAAEAAQVMHQLSPYPYGYPQWRDYHQRFLDRYGNDAVVPVLDLVADSGLGMPAGFLGSERTRPPYQVTDRDEKVMRLLQEVILDASGELVLTRATIADLTADHTEPLLPVPRAEIAVEIHAPTVEAVERGDYRLLVTGAPRPGSSMFGRFAHLLPPPARAALTDSYATASPGAIPAQLSFAPRRRRNENVSRTAQVLPHMISLGQYHEPGPGVIPLDDLAVTADDRRFYLVRMSTGQHVEPRVAHALEASVHTPPLARFLAEINTARSPAYKTFTFGVANTLPYLPRVRYKRAILAPARWLLEAENLPTRSAPMADWNKALDRWRERLHVPDHIALVENDQQLPIDLDQQIHRALLRSCVDRTRLVEVRETTTPQDRAWIGRPHQILIPLANSTLPDLTHRQIDVAVTSPLMPGRSPVLYARLFAHPQRYDEILTGHLPSLLDQFATVPPWWFRRHRDAAHPDSDQRLDLYLHLPGPDTFGPAAQQVHGWADTLHRQHLASHLELSTYLPQAGRYGHGSALDAVHQVFAADSAASVTQIRAVADDVATGQALTAASMVDIVMQFTGGPERAADWLTHALPREHGPLSRDRTALAQALADPARTALLALPGGPDIAASWQHRAAALRAYRDQLAAERDPDTVLRSLLDQHCIRALPVDPDHERAVRRLARACALRHRERQP